MIIKPNGAARQRLSISRVQIAAILGLENFLQAHGFILVCPRCLSDGDPFLHTDNTREAGELKIDCQCKERRIDASDLQRPMDADGGLIAAADSILSPLGLAVRCPERKCINHPIEIERTKESTVIRCRCAKTTLRPPQTILH